MLKAVLFDIDGTIVDSKEANIAFCQQIFQAAGYTPPEPERVSSLFHLPMTQLIEALATHLSAQEVQKLVALRKNVSYPVNLQKIPLHSKKILQSLSSMYKLAIVTSRSQQGAKNYFSSAKSQDFFSTIVAIDDVQNPKPHPEPLLLATQRLGVDVREAVYIGDTHVDVAAAKAAKMKVILRSTVPGADAYFTSFLQLPEILSKII